MAEGAYSKFYVFLVYLALAVSTFVAYEPMRHNGFIVLDDPEYVTLNPHVNGGITRESIVWAFTRPHSANWHSLTWMSHMLDCQLFGLNALGHHLVSLLLHMASTLLLFFALKKMTGVIWPSAFVAALFALHPLHVESVAWVSERKDVLSGFFWMLTMIAYAQYAERPSIGRYLLMSFAFCLGLLSKPMLVTLPFVLILLDYWPLCRFRPGRCEKGKAFSKGKLGQGGYHSASIWRLIWEKVPLLILAAAASVITFVVQRTTGEKEWIETLSLGFRVSNAIVSYISYLGKMIYPRNMAIFYPIRVISSWEVIGCFTILVAILAFIIVSHRGYLSTGWLWYFGTLVPVIGLVRVGSQAMADRYTYLPSIGIFIMIAWGAAELCSKWRSLRIWAGILGVVVPAILVICTRAQVQLWQDSLTLFGHSLKVAKSSGLMHNNYGLVLVNKGDLDRAVKHFRKALQINPRYSEARDALGKTLLKQGNYDEAIRCFNALLSDKENFPDVYGHLGLAYIGLHKDNLAVVNLTKSTELEPNSASNLNNLAWVLATTQDAALYNPTAAVKYAERSCELGEPNRFDLLDTLAVAYAATGNFPEAIKTAEKAIQLAEAASEEDIAREIQERLDLYKSGQAYRQE